LLVLAKSLSDKINISTINELLQDRKQDEIANNYGKNKIDAEEFDGEDIYSQAVECNQEHGIPLTKDEEEQVISNFIDKGITDEEIGKIFHISQQAINKRILSSPMLKKQRRCKINIPTINYILKGKTHEEVANILKVIKRPRVSQIWGNFVNELIELYETGTPKKELVEIQKEKNYISLQMIMNFVTERVP